jgi:hypothetical protein
LSIGFDATYACIANVAPDRPAINKQTEAKPLEIDAKNSANYDHLESWIIENESILGAKLLRETKEGERIGNNQLVALRTQEANAFMLGTVSWRSVTIDGRLQMGIQYLPGVALPVTLKTKDTDSAQRKLIKALVLPNMPTLKIPSSLIIPQYTFQANLACELIETEKVKNGIKMGFSVSAGTDFERISYIPD